MDGGTHETADARGEQLHHSRERNMCWRLSTNRILWGESLKDRKRDKRLVAKRKQAAPKFARLTGWERRATLAGYVGTGH